MSSWMSTTFKTKNSSDDNQALIQRGSTSVWFDAEMVCLYGRRPGLWKAYWNHSGLAGQCRISDPVSQTEGIAGCLCRWKARASRLTANAKGTRLPKLRRNQNALSETSRSTPLCARLRSAGRGDPNPCREPQWRHGTWRS